MSRLAGRARALAIFIGEDDQWHGQPLHAAIVERAHKAGLAGATAFHGTIGFGAKSVIHRPHAFRLSQDLPVLVYVVDAADRIEAFVAEINQMVGSGLVATWDVEVIA